VLKRLQKSIFVKFPAPRPNFHNEMTEKEKELMQGHSAHWATLLQEGKALATGPVLDPNSTFGFGVLLTENDHEAREWVKDDPGQQINKFELYPMFVSYIEKLK
jgi:uncharacterized protein YciI